MGELSERSESIPMIIGIAGGTGSGKSTFSRELILRIGTGRILHLSYDSYYRDLSAIPLEERVRINFDHPDSLETDLLIQHLKDDFQLHFYKFEILPLIILFIAVFIQSSAEEVVCRAFLYQRILKRYNSEALVIGVNSAFFAALHLGNNGISV